MTREDIQQDILNKNNKHLLLELATGVGKSKIALSLINKRLGNTGNILIVIPKLVLSNTWKEEINKWYPNNKWNITICCYKSFHKYSVRNWDYVIFDEVQHLSDRCVELCSPGRYKNTVLLSATVKKEKRRVLEFLFKDLYTYKFSARDAMDSLILPDPKVFLIPLTLDDEKKDYMYIKNPKSTNVIFCEYKDRLKYWYRKDYQVHVRCTQKEYLSIIDTQIDYYKNLYYGRGRNFMKNLWLQKCNERLKFLSSLKTDLCKELLAFLKHRRTITFCSSIKQTELLGKYCINSKNSKASKYLGMFNVGKIKHITACNMLDEGK